MRNNIYELCDFCKRNGEKICYCKDNQKLEKLRKQGLIITKHIREIRLKASKKYYENNKQKVINRVKFWKAKKSGKIVQKPCEVCGNIQSEGHHNDYAKPYEVVWLCKIHHELLHREKKLSTF